MTCHATRRRQPLRQTGAREKPGVPQGRCPFLAGPSPLGRISPYIKSRGDEWLGGPTDGWEEQQLVLGVGEYRARHRRPTGEALAPRSPAVVPVSAACSLRFQLERVLLLFDEVDRPTPLSVERPAPAARERSMPPSSLGSRGCVAAGRQ